MEAFGNEFSSFVEITCFVGFNNVELFSWAKVASFANIVVGDC